jgi:hypothetical protein
MQNIIHNLEVSLTTSMTQNHVNCHENHLYTCSAEQSKSYEVAQFDSSGRPVSSCLIQALQRRQGKTPKISNSYKLHRCREKCLDKNSKVVNILQIFSPFNAAVVLIAFNTAVVLISSL